jgi:metallo-beta-lactamase class B
VRVRCPVALVATPALVLACGPRHAATGAAGTGSAIGQGVAWAGRVEDRRAGDAVLATDVLVRRIAPGLWEHVTLGPGAYAGYPGNGLLLETPDGGAVLFDTGWTDAQTDALLRWTAGRGHPVRRAVITHAHIDRLGGLGALRARGIPAAGLALTALRARRERLLPPGVPAPDSVPGLSAAAVRDGAGFELFYPGAGHAPDNVVAYFPAQRVLFGGCLVRADTATTVGNVADADVDNWPRAVARVRAAYPDARLVVPGHGAVGGVSALAWTERLVTEKGPAARRMLGG